MGSPAGLELPWGAFGGIGITYISRLLFAVLRAIWSYVKDSECMLAWRYWCNV